MFESLRKKGKRLLNDGPGKRFRRQYQRRQEERSGIIHRILVIAGGLLIVGAGIFFLPAPGPGTLIIFLGLGIISQESLWMATMLDKLEVYLRELYESAQKEWKRASLVIKVLMVLLALIITAGFLYAAYWLFWL